MIWQNAVLSAAGVIGTAVAIVHGIRMQRHMVKPLETAAAAGRLSGTTQRLISPLLHFSTAFWFIGGLALIVAANLLEHDARLAVSLLVGGSYLFGAVFNCWATRGRHPGWMLLAAALVLIVVGVVKPGI